MQSWCVAAAIADFVKGTPGADNQIDVPRAENKDSPAVLDLEGPNPDLDAGSLVCDGLSDPNNLPDDAKIVDTSDL